MNVVTSKCQIIHVVYKENETRMYTMHCLHRGEMLDKENSHLPRERKKRERKEKKLIYAF